MTLITRRTHFNVSNNVMILFLRNYRSADYNSRNDECFRLSFWLMRLNGNTIHFENIPRSPFAQSIVFDIAHSINFSEKKLNFQLPSNHKCPASSLVIEDSSGIPDELHLFPNAGFNGRRLLVKINLRVINVIRWVINPQIRIVYSMFCLKWCILSVCLFAR